MNGFHQNVSMEIMMNVLVLDVTVNVTQTNMASPEILVQKIKKALYDYEDRVLGEDYLDLRAVDGNKARELFKVKMEEEVFMPPLTYFKEQSEEH